MLALYIIGGIILFFILVLAVPVELVLDLATGKPPRTRLGWLFGLVWLDLRQGRKPRPKQPPRPRRRRRFSLQSFMETLRNRDLFPRFLRFFRRLLCTIKIREMEATVRFGLEDPAMTGIACGLLWPAFLPAVTARKIRLQVEPAFNEAVFAGNLHGRIEFLPLELIAIALAFVLSPTGFRALRLVRAWR